MSDAENIAVMQRWFAAVNAHDREAFLAQRALAQALARTVAETRSEEDELVVHACDLDATRFGKETIFDFKRHRRIEHYGRIISQTGVTLPE